MAGLQNCWCILVILLILGYGSCSPCQRYHLLEMYNGRRHIEAEQTGSFICDYANINQDNWYRLLLDGQNFDVAGKCQPRGFCNTFAPIWMVGDYPTKAGVVGYNTLCSNYDYDVGDQGNCTCHPDWADGSKKVNVQLCEGGHGGDFYIHRFDSIPGCNTAVCVQNSTTNLTNFDGDRLHCDKAAGGDCSSVTIALGEKLTDPSVDCLFLGDKTVTLQPLWVTPTVVQCPVPSVNVSRGTETLNGLYTLSIAQTADSTDIKQTVEFLLFDSFCEMCDASFDCTYKNGTCVVDGQCTEGNSCIFTTESPATTTTAPGTDDGGSSETSLLLILSLLISLVTLLFVAVLAACYCKWAKRNIKIDDANKTESDVVQCPKVPGPSSARPGYPEDRPPPYSPRYDQHYEIPVSRRNENVYETIGK